jgi:hypothetical protein
MSDQTVIDPRRPGLTTRHCWRDYLDPVAVVDAVGWPAHHK